MSIGTEKYCFFEGQLVRFWITDEFPPTVDGREVHGAKPSDRFVVDKVLREVSRGPLVDGAPVDYWHTQWLLHGLEAVRLSCDGKLLADHEGIPVCFYNLDLRPENI